MGAASAMVSMAAVHGVRFRDNTTQVRAPLTHVTGWRNTPVLVLVVCDGMFCGSGAHVCHRTPSAALRTRLESVRPRLTHVVLVVGGRTLHNHRSLPRRKKPRRWLS